MKSLKTSFILLAGIMIIAIKGYPQDTSKDKKAAKAAKTRQMVDAKDFTFTAQSANPLRGGTINLTAEYDLKIKRDSLIAYLPFYGRAYVAPIDPMEGGIKFTSTNFSYASAAKKSGYEIVIKPADTKDVKQMVLSISSDGYGTLQIINQDRDPITFYGYVEANKMPNQN